MKRPEVLAGVHLIAPSTRPRNLQLTRIREGVWGVHGLSDVEPVTLSAAAFDAYCAEVEALVETNINNMANIEQRIAAAVAQEREAILTLGEKFDYDEKDEYTQAIRSRGAEEGK